jgi:gamma-glutamyltranspeptidase/glutathione hydrolase
MPTLESRSSVSGRRHGQVVVALLLSMTTALSAQHMHSHGPDPASAREAVAANDPLAVEVGRRILQAGGNAADAAVATALALAVVYPEAGNLGGGGFAVARIGDQVKTLDFRETAPAKATTKMYLDADGQPKKGASLIGPLAAGVPGSPAGLYELHRALGKLPWAQVVGPAHALATNGFAVSEHLHYILGLPKNLELLSRFPETAAVWLPGGKPLRTGSIVRLPALARTLEAYAQHGSSVFEQGMIPAALEETAKRHGGVLAASDLAAYKAVWREPVTFEAFGWHFASMPLPSAGGIELGQVFGMLSLRGWDQLPAQGADRAQLLAEAFRRSYADRTLLGDPSTSVTTANELLALPWIEERARTIDLLHATPSKNVGPWEIPRPLPAEPTQTTHLSVIDRDGNLVSLTTTLNALFGCGLYVPQVGIFLNDEMDDFNTAPGQPNLFGLIQGEANEVHPGKRMLSSMAQTIASQSALVAARGFPPASPRSFSISCSTMTTSARPSHGRGSTNSGCPIASTSKRVP